ncbi:RagB/SusD family nutrient uptake outer membrane protein [Aestuariibaculum sp. M13]|uniref:RagB/SusD family nutrient uptake outer membrane protein n=1 Tax=Aestuariibaculum sp. M13 TaxID=2967132 RepID=UPI002159E0A5|nr:RagB/SusD family nutrient uptake outer membrane protein [Aestuariibaculum sp. M13]MCR8667474.1 RagB/SusD family nutrient uptake outer membrane protein [Aestuariibaculum sp. M13]
MKTNISIYLKALLLIFLLSSIACQKQDDWLNVKRLSLDVTPVTLEDFQALLDNGFKLNMKFPAAGLLGTDNIVLSEANFLSVSETEQNLFTFAKDVWNNGESRDWNDAYAIMEYANIVLDGLKELENNTDDAQLNNIKGQALFFRSFSLFSLSQLFCKSYDSSTAETDLGLPVRLTSDVNQLYSRSSLSKTYQQMLQDAKEASVLLAEEQITNFRPNQAAALGLLAKIYLVMGKYEEAGMHAENALLINGDLMNFNDTAFVDSTSTYPFPSFGIDNPEILFNASNNNYPSLGAGLYKKQFIDSDLYTSYDEKDLRKKYLYRIVNGNIIFNGSYSGGIQIFCGIGTNELLLIKAECNVRQGNNEGALASLNYLLKNRYETDSFSNYSLSEADSILKLIITERRKELPLTGNVRWEDLKRFQVDPDFQTTVTHTIGGIDYTLLPSDPKYVLPIPNNEIELSNIEQNIR